MFCSSSFVKCIALHLYWNVLLFIFSEMYCASYLVKCIALHIYWNVLLFIFSEMCQIKLYFYHTVICSSNQCYCFSQYNHKIFMNAKTLYFVYTRLLLDWISCVCKMSLYCTVNRFNIYTKMNKNGAFLLFQWSKYPFIPGGICIYFIPFVKIFEQNKGKIPERE